MVCMCINIDIYKHMTYIRKLYNVSREGFFKSL